MIEHNLTELNKIESLLPKGLSNKGVSLTYSYDEAYKLLIEDETFQKSIEDDIDNKVNLDNQHTEIKDKKYFRKIKKHYKKLIREAVNRLGLIIRDMDTDVFINEAFEEMHGYHVLKDLYYSKRGEKYGQVTEIMCISWNKIYYEAADKKGMQRYDKSFRSEKDYDNFIERMLKAAGEGNLDAGENKYIDFDLYEDRYQAIAKCVAASGAVLTIRIHSEDHVTIDDILNQGGMSQDVADIIGLFYEGECNTIIAGITGSGKTTTLRAILDGYVQQLNRRILVCEDTRELFLKNEHTVELVTVEGQKGTKSDITLRDLVTFIALRQKPDYVVVGEVRGPEAEAAIEAAATGHSTHLTMHAGIPIQAINRLETKYITQMPTLSPEVVERMVGEAVDYIIIQDKIPNIGRRISYITEVSYDYKKSCIKLTDIMKFNPETETFDFYNSLAQDKVDLMLRRGVKTEKINKFQEIIRKHIAEREIRDRDFNDPRQ